MPEKRGKLLIVEDDEGLRRLLIARFRSEGFDVMAAESRPDAMALFAEEKLEAAILDLELPGNLPGSDGESILSFWKELFRVEFPVVIFSAHPLRAREALRNGAAAFVPKSAPLSTLVAEVRKAVSEKPDHFSDEAAYL